MNMLDALIRKFPSLLSNQGIVDARNTINQRQTSVQPTQMQPQPIDIQQPNSIGQSLGADMMGNVNNSPYQMDAPSQQPQFVNQQQAPSTIGQSLQPNMRNGLYDASNLIRPNQMAFFAPPQNFEEEQRRRQSIEYAGY